MLFVFLSFNNFFFLVCRSKIARLHLFNRHVLAGRVVEDAERFFQTMTDVICMSKWTWKEPRWWIFNTAWYQTGPFRNAILVSRYKNYTRRYYLNETNSRQPTTYMIFIATSRKRMLFNIFFFLCIYLYTSIKIIGIKKKSLIKLINIKKGTGIFNKCSRWFT